jgi:DNA-3-methyladenine glycosylase II
MRIPVREPFRLDMTANALRRLATNLVDRFDGGIYRRALATPAGVTVVRVSQPASDALAVAASGAPLGDDVVEAFVRRSLGIDVDLSPFRTAAAQVPWLDALARRMIGLSSPRYPSLWEACVNAVTYQQVSIHAASAILGRVVTALAPAVDDADGPLRAFPDAERFAAAAPDALRALGLSANKVSALQDIARCVIAGELQEAAFADRSTPEAIAELVRHRGIGPWTAAVICLRGLGRLDVFPENDSGVARAMKDISGDIGIDGPGTVALLGAQRGMLYYHLLLGKLAARGSRCSVACVTGTAALPTRAAVPSCGLARNGVGS